MANGTPVSGRAVRRAVGDSIATINAHATAIREVDAAVGVLREDLALYNTNLSALTNRCEFFLIHGTFWQRLKWLVKG